VDYAPAEQNLLSRHLEVRRWCARNDLRVPSLYSSDIKAGWAIFEDFGEADAEGVLGLTGADERLELATTLLGPLMTLASRDPRDLPAWNPPLDQQRLRWELAGFELWGLRYRLGHRPSRVIGSWFDELAAAIDRHPTRICHRDYHLNNIFLMRTGSVGLIDYQDILVGPDTYDAVSLLCERGMPGLLGSEDRTKLQTTWAESTGAAPGWSDRWQLVRIQRGLKALGTFARLGASGTTDYEPWLKTLARELAADFAVADAPVELIDLLLDL
jgi:aminoglycoside/choline kinase family phosphotransferase